MGNIGTGVSNRMDWCNSGRGPTLGIRLAVNTTLTPANSWGRGLGELSRTAVLPIWDAIRTRSTRDGVLRPLLYLPCVRGIKSIVSQQSWFSRTHGYSAVAQW